MASYLRRRGPPAATRFSPVSVALSAPLMHPPLPSTASSRLAGHRPPTRPVRCTRADNEAVRRRRSRRCCQHRTCAHGRPWDRETSVPYVHRRTRDSARARTVRAATPTRCLDDRLRLARQHRPCTGCDSRDHRNRRHCSPSRRWSPTCRPFAMTVSARLTTSLCAFASGEMLLLGGTPILEIMTMFESSCREPLVRAPGNGIGMCDCLGWCLRLIDFCGCSSSGIQLRAGGGAIVRSACAGL